MLTSHPCLPRQAFQIMKNKILIFAVGLVAGLTIGVLFSVAIKELIIQFEELHISLKKINQKQSQLSQRLDSMQAKLVPDTKKINTAPTQSKSKPVIPNSAKATEIKDNVKSPDSKATNASSADITAADSDIVVMTNELISVIHVPLKDTDTGKVNKKTRESDSTLAAMSDVSDSNKNLSYRIEFWKSPLNYKGYKMSTGKIILYGINPVTPVSLVLRNQIHYLLVNQSAYRLDFTDDYKPYERVTDKTLLKKLGYED